MKPQYETWSVSKITTIKVTFPIKTDIFPNVKFKVVTNSSSQVHEFMLVDVACLNPYHWIKLYNLFLRDGQKYESVIAHLMQMLISYIKEVGKMDVEIATVLRRNPCVLPKEVPGEFHKACLFLADKHLFTTSFLEYVLDMVNKYNGNNTSDKKCFSDMILRYIHVLNVLLDFIPKVLKCRSELNSEGLLPQSMQIGGGGGIVEY
ncbi:unnamed protein product [Lactuca saligna]|uniref:Uncharacterized protein n=1 Tax=Lactuca saligna TaxID=75948 RepID=A0AA35YWW3_LACSI|nr:unnamed protein product [Lactuca saligna]